VEFVFRTADFLKALRQTCTEDEEQSLILDEIQSGYGRSGKFFAHQHSGILPDLITVKQKVSVTVSRWELY
jgi:acetylornithine/N-succinyldiaminopimelate aminotransferase